MVLAAVVPNKKKIKKNGFQNFAWENNSAFKSKSEWWISFARREKETIILIKFRKKKQASIKNNNELL